MTHPRIVTGIYGGLFNPIHEGHTRLGEALCDMGLVDELWFMVSPQNPLKVNDELLADEERLRLARMALADSPRIQVSDFELACHVPPTWYTHWSSSPWPIPDGSLYW